MLDRGTMLFPPPLADNNQSVCEVTGYYSTNMPPQYCQLDLAYTGYCFCE